ncbi:MAG: hypothetical protein ACJ75J_06405 [Cytophagaceae bacterium]
MTKFYSPRGFLFLSFFTLLILSQLSCKKKEQASISTDLKVNVRFFTNYSYDDPYYYKSDEEDSTVGANATIMLFKTVVDMQAKVRPVLTAKTDANGEVTIKGIEPFPYFVYVFYDDNVYYYDNSVRNYNMGDAMVEGGLTGISIPIFKKRPSDPLSLGMNFVEVVKYDTLAGGCSKYLKFVLYDSYESPLDSTVVDSYSQFCPKSSLTSDNATRFYFEHADSLQDLTYFGYTFGYFELIAFESADFNTQPFVPVDTIYLTPGYVFKDNPYKNLPYPERVRMWQDAHKTVDINLTWK